MLATIDLGGTNTKFGLVHQGKIIASSAMPAEADGKISDHLEKVLVEIKNLCAKNNTKLEQLSGIGVLSTGLINNKEMSVLSTNGKYDDAVDFDFVAWAKEKAGLELRLENDARGALLGEWRYGAGQGVDNIMMITLGTGVGTAVLSNGEILTGPNFTMGNLGGHIVVNSHGRDCTCGNKGCLEAEAAGWSLPGVIQDHELFAKSSLQDKKHDWKNILEQAELGDACALAIREHCLDLWGQAMISFVHTFDPQVFIIGGGVMKSPDIVLDRFNQLVRERAWAEEGQVQFRAAENPDDMGLLGAAALFHQEELLAESANYPLFFEPLYKTALWGGTLINTLDRNDLPVVEEPIGESWEIVDRPGDQSVVANGSHQGKTLGELIAHSPELIVGKGHPADAPFPLLMKIIDAGQDLSLQVHPDEETCKFIADAEPKTEMWYVLDREPKAQIMAGIKEGVTEDQFRDKITHPSVRDLMLSYDAEKGQSYFIKATTMHAIGGGNLIYEIQQNSNTTYRVSDWGRVDSKGNPRELHVDQAMLCLKHQNPEPKVAPKFSLQAPLFTPIGENPTLTIRQLANCDFFQVEEIHFQGELSFENTGDSFTSFYATDADVEIIHQAKPYILERGKTCLMPALAGQYSIKSEAKVTILKSSL